VKQLTLRRTVITLAALSGLLAATAVGSALLGPEHIGLGRAVAILTGHDTPLSDSDIGRTILLHIRLPRIVLAALVGATLAVT
jgi:ABC-type Fe3+-siderophore transport system permease subunit